MKSVVLILNEDDAKLADTLSSIDTNIDICVINKKNANEKTKMMSNILVNDCCGNSSQYSEEFYINGVIKKRYNNEKTYTYIEVDSEIEDLAEQGLKILSVSYDVILLTNKNTVYKAGAISKILSKFSSEEIGFVYFDGIINGEVNTLGLVDIMIDSEIPIKNYAVRSNLIDRYKPNPFFFALECFNKNIVSHIPEYLYKT